MEEFLKERGLALSPEKTRVTHIEEGFDFLGQNIRSYKEKLLIKPAKKNVQAFLTKVRTIVDKNKTAPQESLIKMLPPWSRDGQITTGTSRQNKPIGMSITKSGKRYGDGAVAVIQTKAGAGSRTGISNAKRGATGSLQA